MRGKQAVGAAHEPQYCPRPERRSATGFGRPITRCVTATDGADGLLRAAEHRTELRAVITDLHMPHMDGLAFVRALRRMLPKIPVAVASGRMENAAAAELKTLGVACWLTKPFTEAQLVEALKTLLVQK